MGMSDNKTVNGSLGFCEMLGLLFIGLRLANVIDWPWLWVLSPIWIPISIFLVVLLVIAVIEYRKRIPCLFKGHDYQGEWVKTESLFGYGSTYIVRCARCGKVR